MSMSITERLAASLRDLDVRSNGRRRPKAFYLNADDWSEFEATKPGTVETVFGNNPPTRVIDAAFQNVPVRPSKSRTSRLYDHTSTGRSVQA